jgi:hypothetical protein
MSDDNNETGTSKPQGETGNTPINIVKDKPQSYGTENVQRGLKPESYGTKQLLGGMSYDHILAENSGE